MAGPAAGAPRAVTSKDVARVAGVSQSTVSYVMSGRRPISPRTRRLVEDAMAQLSYEPHAGARALAGRRTQVVAVVMPFLDAYSAHGLMAFVEEITLTARAHDHDVLLVTADEGPAGLRRVVGRALCDAVVVMEVRTHDPRVEVATGLRTPTVFVGIPADAPESLPCIDFDFEEAARLLVAELHASRSPRIAAVDWDDAAHRRDLNYLPRFRSAAEAEAARLGVPLDWWAPTAGPDGLDATVAQLLERSRAAGEDVPGVLAAWAVPGTTAALQRAGLVPGADVDLVALTTDEQALAQRVPLTGVSTRPREVSRQAVERVVALLAGDDPGGARLVPAALVRRASVRPA